MRREIKESGNCVMSPDGEILAFPDGEGARRADRVDYHERSEVVWFSIRQSLGLRVFDLTS